MGARGLRDSSQREISSLIAVDINEQLKPGWVISSSASSASGSLPFELYRRGK